MKNIFDVFPDSYIESSKRIIQTPSPVARSTFFYVQETGYLKLRESHRASRKNLDSYLIVLVLSGSGTLMYENKTFSLQQGSCFFIDCMTPYYHQSNPEDPWELIWVHFQGATTSEYYRFFSSLSTPVLCPLAFAELHEKFKNLLVVNKDSNLSAEIASSRLIVDILSILMQEIILPQKASTPHKTNLENVRNYLDEHYTEKFSLDQLAEIFFISKYYLCREFKNLYGITLNHYVIAKRITFAKKLLRFTSYTLEEIALKSGFYDASYFNKQFKKSEGISASDFRKKWVN
ncbi:MAG: helix-turn-helix domain-containing protein [Lachnospiraceae bacterium]|nr:helix-turn-helix domain-containing protein [Lachnospiraceae bacterium]